MSDEKRASAPPEESDALSEEDLDKVSGGVGPVPAKLDLKKATLKSSQVASPIINVGMERNEADEITGAATKTIK